MSATEFAEQLVVLENSLLKYAYHLRLNNSDARDLVQETFLKAIENRERFVDVGYLKAWIFTIMRNTFINNYRHNTLQKTLCDNTPESFLISHTRSSASYNPDSEYSYKEITCCIDNLKDKFSVPFKMYLAGYKYREIADNINLKLETVKSRIFLARKLLMIKLNS